MLSKDALLESDLRSIRNAFSGCKPGTLSMKTLSLGGSIGTDGRFSSPVLKSRKLRVDFIIATWHIYLSSLFRICQNFLELIK